MTGKPKLKWEHPNWQKQAHESIHTQAERQSIQITGEIEQPHMYPWSTVMRIPTNEGTIFYKATAVETV